MSEWQPIETAPKDGTEILLRVKKRAGVTGKYLVGHYMEEGSYCDEYPPIDKGWYFWNGCSFDKASEPTNWMHLPEPPKDKDDG
jgi:hypothetical protein